MRTYFDLPGAKLVALCDTDEAVLNKCVQEAAGKGIKATAYRDYQKLLEDKGVDTAGIATPTTGTR